MLKQRSSARLKSRGGKVVPTKNKSVCASNSSGVWQLERPHATTKTIIAFTTTVKNNKK